MGQRQHGSDSSFQSRRILPWTQQWTWRAESTPIGKDVILPWSVREVQSILNSLNLGLPGSQNLHSFVISDLRFDYRLWPFVNTFRFQYFLLSRIKVLGATKSIDFIVKQICIQIPSFTLTHCEIGKNTLPELLLVHL